MKFIELVDISELRELCESFTALTDAVTAILDLEGNILVATGWQDICTRFHRVNPQTACRCTESDTVIAGQLKKGERYNIYKCKNGLVDVAVPITVGGEHVANFFSGQFFFEPPDIDFFSRQAEEFGFDKTAYLDALSRVPVYSEGQVKARMDFFFRLARLIGEMGLAGKRLEEANVELRRHQEHLQELVKERTAELMETKERAETANRAKSAFLSTMSHELRTPLNAILGYAQILKRQNNLSDKQRQQLEIMRTSGEHLLTLINDILDMGKIEAQKMELEEMMFDLPSMLGQAFNIARIKAEEKDLIFHYEAGSGLPEYVRGDERKLRQVLLNLLSNAVKYTRRGKVALRVSYDNGDAGLFRCEVEDTGIGIAQDKLKTIFEPFTQLAAEGQVHEGSGLGLAITKRLVTLMGGRIGVESEPGKGSTFRVEMPLPAASAGEIAVEKARVTVTGYRGERKRILVVEDNITNASMLVSMLEPLGFEVATAGNGREALSLAIEQRPDLVLLDLVMPEMDGLEAVKEMRVRRELDETRIIGVSASATKSSRRDAFIAACDDFAVKPIQLDTLLEKIDSQLGIVWETALPGVHVAEAQAREHEEPTLPPPEEMIELYELALRGDMREIQAWAAALEERDDRFSRFAGRLRELAGGYKAKAILALIEHHRGKENDC